VSDVWSERAEAFRESPTHREGPDLDLVVEWCEPGPGVKALDVATGGGHVARRLKDAGCEAVVTVDPAPGMGADVVARAEHLPFADGSFDVVVTRIAAHHFQDVRAAVAEMARVSNRLLVVEDNLFVGDDAEGAERLRDPTHVRRYSEEEWKDLVTDAGFEVEQVQMFDRRQDFEAWLRRVETPEEDAERVRELLADWVEDGQVSLPTIVLQARKSQG
jgi:SAM-dependent methyltransferase